MGKIIREYLLANGVLLHIVQGDITREQVDAIVNAANSYLQHGGGVAGAIVHQGGNVIQQESDVWVQQHGLVSHETPAFTSAGNLPCTYVIHAVGPVWGSGDEHRKLAAAITGSLELAEQLKLSSIAFPAISTGIFGYPLDQAAEVILQAIRNYFILRKASTIHLVRMTLFDNKTAQFFIKVCDRIGIRESGFADRDPKLDDSSQSGQ